MFCSRTYLNTIIHIRDGLEMSESMSERRLKPLPIGFLIIYVHKIRMYIQTWPVGSERNRPARFYLVIFK